MKRFFFRAAIFTFVLAVLLSVLWPKQEIETVTLEPTSEQKCDGNMVYFNECIRQMTEKNR